MLQINITTQPARLDYNIQNARLNLQTTQPVVQMERTPPALEIRQPHGELTIDWTPYYYSIGLKNMADFARDNAAFGLRIAMDGLARITAEGHRLARIENKSNAIADIAASSNFSEIPGITWAYIDAPVMHYQAYPVQFNPIAGKVNFTIQSGTVKGDYRPGSVDIRVTQYPSVEISTIDVRI